MFNQSNYFNLTVFYIIQVSKEHVEDAKRLLKLMGIPFVEAPCEAEAQCAELVKGGKVRSLV